MKKIVFVVLLFSIGILSGCATNALYLGKTLDIQNENEIVQLPVDQPQLILASIPMIDYSKAEEVVFECPEKLLEKEYRLFRLSWLLVALDRNGNAFWGIAFLNQDEKSPSGKLYCHGKIFVPEREGYNWIILSTRAVMGYGSQENEFVINRKLFESDQDYRRELYGKGVPLSQTKNPKVFENIVSRWNRFQTPFGKIRTPNKKEIVQQLALEYSGYTVSDRKNRDAKDVISINPIGTGLAKAIDIYNMLWGKTSGWDMESKDKNPKISKAHLDGLKEEAKIVRY